MLGSTVDTCSSVDVLWRCLFQFTVKVVDTALIYRDRYAQFKLCEVVDYPVMAQRTFPLVPCSRPQRFPSCSLLKRWSSWLCRSCSSGTRREETVKIPRLQPVFLDPVVCTPVVCNDSCFVDVLAQFIDGSHVPVITQRRLLSGSADSVIAGDSGHSSCATEKGTRLSALLLMVAVMGFFDAFCVIFRAPPVVPELIASFSSFRVLTTVSARGLQWVCQFILRCCGHTHSLICH